MTSDDRKGLTPVRRAILQAATITSALLKVAPSRAARASSRLGDLIKIGLVGCGHRGRGAVEDALAASPGLKLIAIADVFADKIEKAQTVYREGRFAGKVDLPAERCFVGLDAYQQLLATDVDYVILATPPGFRPLHIQAAVAAGKHIFAEKPIAIDAAGVRSCQAAYVASKAKGLAFVGGTMRRHDISYQETVKRLQGGAIGEIRAARTYWNQGSQWVRPREKGWTDAEWQIRNWFYFPWLSGDQICEQQIHNLDVINWALGAVPISAVAMGGRQQRVDAVFGTVFDHMVVDYTYPGDVHVTCMSRQMENCANQMGDAFVGSLGRSTLGRSTGHQIVTREKTWTSPMPKISPYVQEHADLIASLRAGKPLNELQRLSESCLTAVMGRMAAYTGKAVTWQQATDSRESLYPPGLTLDGKLPLPALSIPGKTPLI